MRTAPLALALLTAATLTACGSRQTPAPAAPSATAPTTAPAPVALDEHAEGTTVHVTVGTPVTVTLHSTYWSPPASSDLKLLIPTARVGGPMTATPTATATPTCHPGGGCGTVSATYYAHTPGTAQLTAHRTSCGEAKPCAPDQQNFTVTVVIAKP
ncbi:hypothetical protein ABT095_15615 [Kitasatospora sp. NPDC002227]|uniref:hypothetical protein n=1 Tax=Kitasatospora sp. NPDC002227 TaxID=3154773 RepID=UPI0033200D5C